MGGPKVTKSHSYAKLRGISEQNGGCDYLFGRVSVLNEV